MSVSVPPAGQDEVLTTGDMLSVNMVSQAAPTSALNPPADLHHLLLLHGGAERGLPGRAGAEGHSRRRHAGLRWTYLLSLFTNTSFDVLFLHLLVYDSFKLPRKVRPVPVLTWWTATWDTQTVFIFFVVNLL